MKTRLIYILPLFGLFACDNVTEVEQPIENVVEEIAALTPIYFWA